MPSGSERLERCRSRRLDRVGDGDNAGRLPSTARKIAVAPSPRSRSASVERAADRCPNSTRNRALPRASRLPSTMPMTPLPAGESNSATGARSSLRSVAAATIAAASGCSLARSTLAASCSTVASSKPGAATIATTLGLPSVSVPVLSITSVSTFSMRSSASAFLIRTPACAPRPTPTMIDIGVASPSAQGQAMISTAHGGDQAEGEARLGAEDAPRPTNASSGDGDHRRHEPARHLIGEALDRRAAALRARDHLRRSATAACRGRLFRRASRSCRSVLSVPPITLRPAPS